MEAIVAVTVAMMIFLSGVFIGQERERAGFSCTESALIEKEAVCVKYERNK